MFLGCLLRIWCPSVKILRTPPVTAVPHPSALLAPSKRPRCTLHPLRQGTGGVADLARSSIKALELSAATQATNYGNSLAGASLTGDLLSAHDASTAGDGGNRTPKSDDASSLKSLEYSRVSPARGTSRPPPSLHALLWHLR